MPRSPWAAGPLDRLARVVKIPALVDGSDVLLAEVAWPAAPARGADAKVTAAGSHAVARRVTFGTEAVGFLEPAIFGLRAIEHPPRAVDGILRGLAPEGSLDEYCVVGEIKMGHPK